MEEGINSSDNNQNGEFKAERRKINKPVKFDRRKKGTSKKHKFKFKKKRIIVPIIAAILMILFGINAAIESLYYQSTDDAYVEGRLVSIAPSVCGHIKNLYVEDNQEVKKGQILFEIDPKIYIAKVHQEEGKLAVAKASLEIADRTIAQNQAIIDQSNQELKSSDSKLQFAQKDYDRYSKMYKIGVSSKQEYDQSSTSLTVSKSSHKVSNDKLKEVQMALKVAQAKKDAAQADIQREQAELEQAKINLSYTRLYAPQAGCVTARSLEQGNYVQVGQAVMAIVPKKMWVIANFKETQLTHMQKGQDVDIHIDTYPGKIFKGRVDSIQRATGAKSSLFPPENAVGSYVKIVQRIPVKIIFEGDYWKYNIVPGMSVVPKVKIKS